MKPVVSTAVMRRCDAAAIASGVPSRELMRRAGEAVFCSYPWHGRTAIVCGTGNNAGDGYVLAGCLRRAGIPCRLLLLEERFSPDGRFYFEECLRLGIPWSLCTGAPDFSGDAEIADCLFGTGFHGCAEGLAAEVIAAINRAGLPVISVDINSGLNGDSGLGSPAVRSTLTVSIGTYKTGHFLGAAKDTVGSLQNADIGIPVPPEDCCRLTETGDFHDILRPRRQLSHKGNYGYVGLLGGCAEYAGAAKLANLSCAALRAGCGVATLMVPQSLEASVSPYLLESTLALLPDRDGHMRYDPERLDMLTGRLRALAVGMGWGRSPENQAILAHLLEHYAGSLVIDADGLNALAGLGPDALRPAAGRVLLTPHCKEFERISGYPMEQIQSDPVGTAGEYAARNGVCLLLKGPCTVVTDGRATYLVNRGCAGMATAGSGDVLSGILAGLLGFSPMSPLTAACGAYINGLAGELAEQESNPISMTASDTVRKIPDSVSRMLHAN